MKRERRAYFFLGFIAANGGYVSSFYVLPELIDFLTVSNCRIRFYVNKTI